MDVLQGRERPRPYVVPDGLSPRERYSEEEFYTRFRMDKGAVDWLAVRHYPGQPAPRRRMNFDPFYRVCVLLRFLATNGFHRLTGDAIGVSVGTNHRIVYDAVERLLSLRRDWIRFLDDFAAAD